MEINKITRVLEILNHQTNSGYVGDTSPWKYGFINNGTGLESMVYKEGTSLEGAYIIKIHRSMFDSFLKEYEELGKYMNVSRYFDVTYPSSTVLVREATSIGE